MTAAELTLRPIFATPFAEGPLGIAADEAAELLAACREAVTSGPVAGESTPLTELSDWGFLAIDRPVISRLRQSIAHAVLRAVQTLSPAAASQPMQADVFGRCCIQHKEGGMTLPPAPLPAASWNAVYALAAGSGGERADSGALRIYETRGSNMYMDASNWGYRPPFGHGHHLWKPVTGQIALFPASCSYEIAPLRGVGEQVLILARLRFKAADRERQV